MRVLFLPTKTLICCNKRNHNFIFYTLTKIVKIRRRRLTDQGRSQDFFRGTHNSPKLLCTSPTPHLPAQLLCTFPHPAPTSPSPLSQKTSFIKDVENDIWVERKKMVRCFRKKTFQRNRVEWIEASYALKIIILRHFAFFLELTLFFIIYSLYIFFVHDFFR